MKTLILSVLAFFVIEFAIGQDNCNVFLWEGDSCRYKACKFLEESPAHFQLTREYHEIKDKAIEMCPEYAIVYKQKSTAYLKTGDFINWKILIDKAVEINPLENLDYRGWCRFQFFRDYQGAIADIEELDRISKSNLGYCQNGDYHLNIAKGLCYKMIGQRERAIQIISNQIEQDTSQVGLYDYLHLGVLYLESHKYTQALSTFKQQLKVNALAECYYYQALAYKALHDQEAFGRSIHKAKERYQAAYYMLDIYTHHIDKIYLSDILREIMNSEG